MLEDRGIGSFPDWFAALGQKGLIGPVPFALIAFVVLFVLLYVVLERSGFGRKTYVIGTNRDVADFAGIDTARHKIIIFTMSGARRRLRGPALRRPRRCGARRCGHRGLNST